jgi:hypothetical protein
MFWKRMRLSKMGNIVAISLFPKQQLDRYWTRMCLFWLLILIGRLYLKRCVVTFGFKNRRQIIHMFKRCWITCSKFVDYSKFNSRHNGVGGGGVTLKNYSNNMGDTKIPQNCCLILISYFEDPRRSQFWNPVENMEKWKINHVTYLYFIDIVFWNFANASLIIQKH